ncbi:MAG: Cys-tRNA(Pro) deacylase [Dethiobacteria bacterium]|nr:Cys-tRNA(Pro) deacylase [Dethiobacteria bacterium]
MKKTNAVRKLDSMKLLYRLKSFVVDESDLSAERAAELLGSPLEQVFKTLIARGDKSGIIVVSIPGGSELDLKALARLSGNKSVEMVPLKEVQPLTGYVRGAVSPLGMKNSYPCFIDESAFSYPEIIISAGLRGLQIELDPRDLVLAAAAHSGKLIRA